MGPPRHVALCLTLLFAGCSSTPQQELAELYEENAAILGSTNVGDQAEVEAERLERIGAVKQILLEVTELEPIERLYAACVLLDSRDPEDQLLARDLALSAAEDGDEQGFPIAAEAIDCNLMLQNLPQRYGTQFIYIRVTGRWIMYRLDSRTTDTMRTSMGVPKLEVLLEHLKTLNGDA